jgi:hypothetical protein
MFVEQTIGIASLCDSIEGARAHTGSFAKRVRGESGPPQFWTEPGGYDCLDYGEGITAFG